MNKATKVLVFGASGKTGKLIVKKLLKDGFSVIAFVRNPATMASFTQQNLRIVKGDILDYDSVQIAVKECDIVVSALGNMKLMANTIISDGVSNIIKAMKQYGKSRLLFMSSLGVGDSKGQLGLIYNLIYLPTFLRNVFKDKERQEKLIHESGLEWTVIRPAHFLPFPLPMQYRICVAPKRPRLLPIMSRYHVADFIAKECKEQRYVQQNVSLSYF
jgi:putative NADH-flavin reductase